MPEGEGGRRGQRQAQLLSGDLALVAEGPDGRVTFAFRVVGVEEFEVELSQHILVGDLDRLWRTRHQTTQGRRRGGGADAQGETREGAGCCGDQQEVSRRMYDEIRSSRDPRDHVEDG